MQANIAVSTAIEETVRVAQVRGLFDIPDTKESHEQWNVNLPLESRPWSIGLIVGPSGCGKSTIARHLWPNELAVSQGIAWPLNQTILDAFPVSLSVKDVVSLLSSVGFSSPPSWLRPFHVLSTGQQFRVTLARLLAEAIGPEPAAAAASPGVAPRRHESMAGPIVFDEFTSVVDRTVAQVGSVALAKTVRQRNLQFIAITCHEDIEDWLNPDWVYRAAEGEFLWRFLRGRPALPLEIVRCQGSRAWPLFAPHHYLTSAFNASATSFLATWNGRPVCFSAWLPHVGGGPAARREHRTVVLPDFQGVGIGHRVSTEIAAMWKALGYRAISTTTHPAFIASRNRSQDWRMTRKPSLGGIEKKKPYKGFRHATRRLTAGFEYIGPALSPIVARALHGG